jgi:hypothetical protein
VYERRPGAALAPLARHVVDHTSIRGHTFTFGVGLKQIT